MKPIVLAVVCLLFFHLASIIKARTVADELSFVFKVYDDSGSFCNYGINTGKLGILTWHLIDQLEKSGSMGNKFKEILTSNCGSKTKHRSCKSKTVQALQQWLSAKEKKVKTAAIVRLTKQLENYKKNIVDSCIHRYKSWKPCLRLECVIQGLYSGCFKNKKSACVAKISNPKLTNPTERKIIAAITYHICKYLRTGQCTVKKREKRQPACAMKKHRKWMTVGGTTAMAHQWPWTVSIRAVGHNGHSQHICGGSLIHDQLVLTAAHCVTNCTGDVINKECRGRNLSTLTVVTGEHNIYSKDKGEKTIGVEYFYYHRWRELRRGFQKGYDLAVLKLKSPNRNKKVAQPVCLGTAPMIQRKGRWVKPLVGWQCWVTGWGKTEHSPNSAELQEVQVPVWSHDRCHKFDYETIGELKKYTVLCAGIPDRHDSRRAAGACDGDSGGPMHCSKDGNKWHLMGSVSGGEPRCLDEKPGLFTSVPYFFNFYKAILTGAERLNMPKFKKRRKKRI